MMISQRSLRRLLMLALGALAIGLAPTLTHAQGPSPGAAPTLKEIKTTIADFDPGQLPVVVTYEYERGGTQTRYSDNGDYREPGAEGKGALKGVTVYGTFVPLDATEIIPAASGNVTVTTTTTTYTDKDGTVYVLVVVTITISDP